ncbi:YraN family protein [Nonlabens sp. Ci31]|jgi:putative endonuclease|uniref:YraN family protein n=1 Tax=Nonlabens sp. Ci31 TaxID=2608253 RepID=UPI001462D40A|nr:YraN family protein [Nonlabens sp. Ci31]QJP34088.1 YraN family protein [Nonlabens sp. Ci31]
MAEHNDLGDEGEELAALHLLKSGYDILIRNYSFQKGEIDIIARKKDVVIIVEVKTRSTPDFGDPQDFLKKDQIQRLVATANHYVENFVEDEVEVRFDIVAIIKNKAGTKLEHIEDAFYHF